MGLTTINLCAKIEVSTITHYEDIKGDKNVEIGVVWGLWITQGHRQHKYSIEHIRLSIRL